MSEEECHNDKGSHDKYITFEQFQRKDKHYKQQLMKCFSTVSSNKTILFEDTHQLLESMSGLTGLLQILDKEDPYGPFYYGTGFIVRLKKYGDEESDDFYAIVTVSTAYHIFNDDERPDIPSYKKVNEIWSRFTIKFKLDYNQELNSSEINRDREGIGSDKSGDSSGSDAPGLVADDTVSESSSSDSEIDKKDTLITFYGSQLLETDKDLDYKSDWCAFECKITNTSHIRIVEKRLSSYQSCMSQLYRKSKLHEDINLVVIIGHPHMKPKRISIGQHRKFKKSPEMEISKEVRSHQIWCRYSYDNVACNGISGAPVFIWGQPISGFGYWFGHPHNHSETTDDEDDDHQKVCVGKSTIGTENIV